MRIGVLLAGCGHYDGTDVHEAALTIEALESAGEKPVLLAPRLLQERAVDHLTGDEIPGERRDLLRESARLARAPVRALSDHPPDLLEALIIPGGYGPVVNLATGFARRGQKRSLVPEVAAYLRHFVEHGKPIGAVSLGEVPVRMLLGQEIDMPPPPPDPRALNIDRERRLVHTPGFTAFTRIGDVRAGIEAMVAEVLRLVAENSRALAARAGGEEA
jgi:enhancing lycopene biosynthesis protein 2